MSQETLADDHSHRVGAVRNITFVAFPEMLDVCGPFDVFAFADRWLRKTGERDLGWSPGGHALGFQQATD